MAQVLQCKAGQRQVQSAQPGHGFEAFAHVSRHHELPRLIGQARKFAVIAGGYDLHFAVYAQARQEIALRREARQREPAAREASASRV